MLSERQKRFVELYRAGGGDAAEAAAQAGYSPRRARRQARELLRRPEVAAALDAAERRRAEGVSQEKIVRELARIAFADGEEVRDGDKLRALEMLTKLLPPEGGGADAAAQRCGVVILPEVMAGEPRE